MQMVCSMIRQIVNNIARSSSKFSMLLSAISLAGLLMGLVACDLSSPTSTPAPLPTSGSMPVAEPSATSGLEPTATSSISASPTAGITSSPAIGAARPRILLDEATLRRLRQKATAGNIEWATLKEQCDLYLGGSVEYPDGNNYPDNGSIGAGYQGDGYLHPLLNLGLCYQTTKTVAADTAPSYGAKGADILDKMSDPPGSPHWACPLRDDGYGIRNYGIGMALGYDWLYDALTPALRAKVYTALNLWIDWFEHGGICPDGPQQDGGFERDYPMGNYFAGYYAAKALAALATEGDNPQAPTQWDDWLQRMHLQMVQPYYADHMIGGGWPEGWNYGPLATENMIWPALAARTAKGLDLVHNSVAPFNFPLEVGLNLIHFSWPNRLSLDDRGALYGSDNPARTPSYLYSVLAGVLASWNDPSAPIVHSFAREVRNLQGEVGMPWQDFLFWDEDAPEQDFKTLPLSYLAQGMGTVAMRSSWQTDAVWGSFTSGPYVAYPGSGEQYYDQGSLAIVRGGQPLLANATGALLRNTPGGDEGSSFEQPIYDDLYGSNETDPTLGNGTLFNIFYVRADRYGQTGVEPDQTKTRIGLLVDAGPYVYIRGTDLEDMYRRAGDGTSPLVGAWTREVIYLRPRLFVLYDRTAVSDAGADQWMAFHFAGMPAEVGAPSNGMHRFDVNVGTTFAGSVTTLLPYNHANTLVNVFNSNKVYRLEVRPGTPATDQRWLTVFDAADAPGTVALATRISAADGNVLSGEVQGVLLSEPGTNHVVLFGTGPESQPVSGTISYVVPTAPTVHLLANLAPNTAYSVSVVATGSNQTITVAPGSGFTSDDKGSLYLTTNAQGEVAVGK